MDQTRTGVYRRRRPPKADATSANEFVCRDSWLQSGLEEIIDPDLPIIDPHHHLWDRKWRYLLDELLDDVDSGHNVQATVYVQCTSMYRKGVPAQWASLGETEFVNGIAAMAASGAYGPIEACAGIVGHVDLTLGDDVRPLLERHVASGGGRFKGIRNSTVWDADPTIITTRLQPPMGLLAQAAFRAGFAQLQSFGLSFDAWLYHPQIPELADLARNFPDTTIVLDHVGAPLGINAYAARRQDVFNQWRQDIRSLAACPNVCVKLGGLGMPIMGFDFAAGASPPSSADLARLWTPYFDVCIEAFGVDRCMFESNFPVDKQSYAYPVLWNAFKRYASGWSLSEKSALFRDTAAHVYKLGNQGSEIR